VGARGPQPSLTVERIVAAAMAVLDSGEAVSVRAVAARLDVQPNTIYTYLPDRAALHTAVADRLLALAGPELLTGRRAGRRRIKDYAVALRTVLLERRGAITLFHSAPLSGPYARTISELLLGTFTRAGLSDQDAVRAAQSVIAYVLGAIALSTVNTCADARPGAPLAAVPEPTPIAAQFHATWDSEEQFCWGLDRLLDGLV
jgi:AcrR family transcriptional regulator